MNQHQYIFEDKIFIREMKSGKDFKIGDELFYFGLSPCSKIIKFKEYRNISSISKGRVAVLEEIYKETGKNKECLLFDLEYYSFLIKCLGKIKSCTILKEDYFDDKIDINYFIN